ncbi:hypothetical protein CR513_21050, partial [Mucuna pruriens]
MSKDDQCLMEVLKRLASRNISQRRNAMDVISEALHISSKSQNLMPYSAWQDIANKLLERLGDEEIMIREQASKLLPMINPSLYLSAPVGLVYSTDESQSSASDAIIGALKHHNQRIEIIFLLLDCLSKTSKSLDLPQSTGDKRSKLDTDRVLKLVPVWSKSVPRLELLNRTTGSSDAEIDYDCIAFLLLHRAFCEFEFEDVRKLSAELCGRIHPHVLFPFLCPVLERAVDSKNILKIKACLFSICTSLVVRGWESISHPSMYAIRKMIETVLLWPCLSADSVSKAQHGCIDCLALMICAELQAKESITDSRPDKIRVVGKKGNSFVTYVINQFFNVQRGQLYKVDPGLASDKVQDWARL